LIFSSNGYVCFVISGPWWIALQTRAVEQKKFQKAKKLKADGVVGAATKKVLGMK
jgi:murein L,D-transpeptidase YcbB/YkuD